MNFTLFLEKGVEPEAVLQPAYTSIAQGGSTSISCNVSGFPAPVIMWSRPNGLLSENHVVEGDSLQIFNASMEDSGTYVCSAENKLGLDSSTAVVSVESKAFGFSILTSKKIVFC